MNYMVIFISILLTFFAIESGLGGDDHRHQKVEHTKAEPSKHDEEAHDHDLHEGDIQHSQHEHSEREQPGGHGDDEEAGEHGHEHGDEENPHVGPDKGIISASAKDGIQLSPEAEKNFGIQRVKVSKGEQIELQKTAIVTVGIEINLFRYRHGFYRRIDFDLVQRNGSKAIVRSKELKAGDEVVVQGVGFLRIVEIAAFGGAPEGHSH